MDYPIQCRCGAVRLVSETEAGETLQCHCGASIVVPWIGELRDGVGTRRGPPTPEKTIPVLVDAGDLPLADCATCGSPDVEILWFVAQCERTHIEGEAVGAALGALGSAIPIIGGFVAAAGREGRMVRGRDLDVSVPIGLCANCRASRLPGYEGIVMLAISACTLIAGLVAMFFDWQVGVGLFVVALVFCRIGFRLRRRRRETLVEVLSQVSEYAELFAKYPDATVRREWPV